MNATFPRSMFACSMMTNPLVSWKPPGTKSTSSRVSEQSSSRKWTSRFSRPMPNARGRTGNGPAMLAARSSIFPVHWRKNQGPPSALSGWNASEGKFGSLICIRRRVLWPIPPQWLWPCCCFGRARRAHFAARWRQFSSPHRNKDKKAWTSCTSRPSIFVLPNTAQGCVRHAGGLQPCCALWPEVRSCRWIRWKRKCAATTKKSLERVHFSPR